MPAHRLNITRPCLHDGRHKHGTVTAYKFDKCRCKLCADVRTHLTQQKARQQAYGRWLPPFVDAEPVRAHVRALMAQGMGANRIATISGVAPATLNAVLYSRRNRQPSRQVRPATATALLNVRLHVADNTGIDATGSRRRVQALCACGWSTPLLGRMLSVSGTRAHQLRNAERISRAKADAIAALYDELWDAKPPAVTAADRQRIGRALDTARRNRYVPPLAWDDDTIDDPAARPQHNARAVGAGSGHPLDDLRVEAIDDLERVGMSAAQIALRVGCTSRTVQRRRAQQRAQDAA